MKCVFSSGQSCTKAGLLLASELQVGSTMDDKGSAVEGAVKVTCERMSFEVCVYVLRCYLWEL